MANENLGHDDADEEEELSGGAPREGAAPRPSTPEGFLPDDSFLLDVDDETSPAPIAELGSPAPSAASNEEWILVDDDAGVGVGEPARAAAPPPPPAEVAPEHVDAEPAYASSQAPEPAQADPAAAAPASNKVPSWYSGDESELPAFAKSESETALAMSPAAAAPVAEGAPPVESEAQPEESLAPVVPLVRSGRRKIMVAAAALLFAGLGATAWFTFGDRGESDPSLETATRAKPPKPAPTKPVEPEPVAAVEPAPVEAPQPEPLPPEPLPPEPEPPVAALPEVERTPPRPEPTAAAPVDPGRKNPLPPSGRDRKGATPGPKTDTIVELKNGHTFRGQITRTKGSRVTLRVGAGECVFDLSEVTLLDSSAPEYRRIDQMPEASVIFTTGQRLRGRLMKQTDRHVVLVVNNGQVVLPRTDIRDVTFTGRIHF